MSIHAFMAAPELRQRPLLFLDFEASSLSRRSWPIEIGYAWIAGGRVETRARLIAPRPHWPRGDWSAAAARVHGILPADLDRAAPADDVAAETDVFAGFDVVSDNSDWDQRWLDRLREGRGPAIRVRSLRAALRERLDDAGATAMARALFRSASRHRAGPDAERMARAWLASTRAFGQAA